MARFSLKTLPENQRVQLIGEFYDIIASLKNRDEVRLFFRDLLTGDEIAMLMRRIEAAALILVGYTDTTIRTLTGIGKTTTRAVHTKLTREGRGKGYKVVVDRLLSTRKKRIQRTRRKEKAIKNQFERIKQTHKMYYLLDHILEEITDYRERKGGALTNQAVCNTPSRKW